jgi:hypothetical protein
MLRSVLETTVAHAYFGLRGEHFEYLANNPAFRMPPFGGPKGTIRVLAEAGVVPDKLSAECRSLYALCSKATHSHISSLTCRASEEALSTDWAELAPRIGAGMLELVLRLVMKGV